MGPHQSRTAPARAPAPAGGPEPPLGVSRLDSWAGVVGGRPERAGLITTLGIPIASVLLALVVGAMIIVLDGKPPLGVYREMIRGVFGTSFGLADALVNTSPLVLIGVGLALAFRASVFNIGAEGQLLVGAVTATAWATAAPIQTTLPRSVLIVSSCVVGAVGGAVWAGIVAGLNARFAASVVISSLLLNFVAASLVAYFVRIPLKDSESTVPQSSHLGRAVIPDIPGTKMHAGVLLALVVVPLAWFVLFRTRFGYRVRAMGLNPEAFEANEASRARLTTILLCLSGGLAGAAGYLEIAGVQGRLHSGISPGFGFVAIIVALLGRLNPIGVLVAGFALSVMLIGAETAERSYGIEAALISALQGLVVVFVVTGDALAVRFQAKHAPRLGTG